jgi:RNA polymerase sigma-70 factor, ECF subfamily
VRTNEEWLRDLSDAASRDAAIADLRTHLQKGVYYYLSRERSDLADLSSEEITQMAEDFAQEATLRVLDNLDSFRGDSRFTTWAMKIATRLSISEMRRARHKDFSLDALMEVSEPALAGVVNGTTPDRPETATEKSDILQRIDDALTNVLTDRQRAAIESLILDDVPMDLVAEQLNTNRNALYKLVHDARRKLKTYLEEQGLSPDYILRLFEK